MKQNYALSIRQDDAGLRCHAYHSASSQAVLASDVYVCVGIGTEQGANRLQVTADPRMIALARLRRRNPVIGIFDGEDRNGFAGGSKLVLDVVYIAKVHAAIDWNSLRWKAGKYFRDRG